MWGSELKYTRMNNQNKIIGLPLCEVVSWNSYWTALSVFRYGLPLCEVVSWNLDFQWIHHRQPSSTSVWGSELKYACFPFSPPWILSTSVWGSELKCFFSVHGYRSLCLPLCEVVSWNVASLTSTAIPCRLPLCEVVSWNISSFASPTGTLLSTSVWGSELKFLVISQFQQAVLSTSVWGSELKFTSHKFMLPIIDVYLCVR